MVLEVLEVVLKVLEVFLEVPEVVLEIFLNAELLFKILPGGSSTSPNLQEPPASPPEAPRPVPGGELLLKDPAFKRHRGSPEGDHLTKTRFPVCFMFLCVLRVSDLYRKVRDILRFHLVQFSSQSGVI